MESERSLIAQFCLTTLFKERVGIEFFVTTNCLWLFFSLNHVDVFSSLAQPQVFFTMKLNVLNTH